MLTTTSLLTPCPVPLPMVKLPPHANDVHRMQMTCTGFPLLLDAPVGGQDASRLQIQAWLRCICELTGLCVHRAGIFCRLPCKCWLCTTRSSTSTAVLRVSYTTAAIWRSCTCAISTPTPQHPQILMRCGLFSRTCESLCSMLSTAAVTHQAG